VSALGVSENLTVLFPTLKCPDGIATARAHEDYIMAEEDQIGLDAEAVPAIWALSGDLAILALQHAPAILKAIFLK